MTFAMVPVETVTPNSSKHRLEIARSVSVQFSSIHCFTKVTCSKESFFSLNEVLVFLRKSPVLMYLLIILLTVVRLRFKIEEIAEIEFPLL
jgi:hypothetical protein